MLHLNVELITEEVLHLGRDMASIAGKCKTFLSSPNAEAIAAMFPGGTTADKAAITLCNDAIVAANAVTKSAPSIANEATIVNGIFTNLSVQLTQIQHASPKHGIGYYVKVIGCILEDAASLL